MSHLQEMVNKTFLSEALSTSGDTLKQLLISTSTFAPEPTEQSRRFTIQTFLTMRFSTFPFLGILRVV